LSSNKKNWNIRLNTAEHKANKENENNNNAGNTSMLGSSIMGGSSLIQNSALLDIYEETDLEESKKRELDDLIKSVPYNLCVALIKISQLHNYEPLDIETLYQKVLPAFSLLRRNDGTKYTSQSVQTVRSAMVSNKLYTRTEDGKYLLNIMQAIKILKNIKHKKTVNTNQQIKTVTSDDDNNNRVRGNLENFDNNASSFMNYESPSSLENMAAAGFAGLSSGGMAVGGKKKFKKVKKGKEGVKQRIEKFEKTFLVLKNLLKVSSNDKLLYSQLNFDFANIADPTKLGENKLNVDKIIGMLCVFKFFRPFIERCFSSIQCQENIMEKIMEINSEVNYMDSIFKFEEEARAKKLEKNKF